MITLTQIRKELESCKKPLFFFHDDADGLASFLLLYRYVNEGRGMVIKTNSGLDEAFVRRVEEYSPDKVFITDFSRVKDVFLENVKVPIIWIDHHPITEDIADVLKMNNVKYYNPRVKTPDKNIPATKICYDIVKQDLWIGAVGTIGDWVFIPSFMKKVNKEFPKLLSKDIKMPGDALFSSKFGLLARIFATMLKGQISEINKCIKILTRIKSPEEILNQTTPQGSFIFKRYSKLNQAYVLLLERAKKQVSKDKLFVFSYTSFGESFTGALSNELLYLYPKKVAIIAREKSGEMRCSLRSPPEISVSDMLEKSLIGLDGKGGGHPQSCGCNVKIEQWAEFIENMKRELKKQVE